MDESKIELTERLRREGRWEEASSFRETARADFRAHGMSRKEAAWDATAEAYPPLPVADSATVTDNGRVQELAVGEIPPDWPTLSANASLQAELSWVQSNRLLVVEERPSRATRVHLDQAREPAPSWSALSQLETSIRAYAKYVDVVAKSLKDEQDEAENVRREKKAIAEIEELLAEMHED